MPLICPLSTSCTIGSPSSFSSTYRQFFWSHHLNIFFDVSDMFYEHWRSGNSAIVYYCCSHCIADVERAPPISIVNFWAHSLLRMHADPGCISKYSLQCSLVLSIDSIGIEFKQSKCCWYTSIVDNYPYLPSPWACTACNDVACNDILDCAPHNNSLANNLKFFSIPLPTWAMAEATAMETMEGSLAMDTMRTWRFSTWTIIFVMPHTLHSNGPSSRIRPMALPVTSQCSFIRWALVPKRPIVARRCTNLWRPDATPSAPTSRPCCLWWRGLQSQLLWYVRKRNTPDNGNFAHLCMVVLDIKLDAVDTQTLYAWSYMHCLFISSCFVSSRLYLTSASSNTLSLTIPCHLKYPLSYPALYNILRHIMDPFISILLQ